MQCYTKEKLDSHFEHWLEYARDALCRQSCSTSSLKVSCKKLYTTSMILINGREISYLQFADDIGLIAGTEEELQEQQHWKGERMLMEWK